MLQPFGMAKIGAGKMGNRPTREDVILALYDAPLSQDGWHRATELLSAYLEAKSGATQGIDFDQGTGEVWGLAGISAADLAKADPNWVQHDPYIPLAKHLTANNSVGVASRHMEIETFENSLALRELFPSIDRQMNDVVTTGVIEGNNVLGAMMLYTEHRGEYHSDQVISEMESLAPHIRKAILLTGRFSQFREINSLQNQLLDGLTYGMVVIDRDGGIALKNSIADDMLRDGNQIHSKNNSISAFWQADDAQLQTAIRNARIRTHDDGDQVVPFASYMKLRSQCLSRELSVVVSPISDTERYFHLSEPLPGAKVLVCFSDREPIFDARAKTFSKVHGLTAQETSVLVQLVNGQTARKIADGSGRSVETIRSQIKAIMQKSDTVSQLELFRLVMSSPVLG